MSRISALPAEIAAWLATCPQLAGIRFLTEFPPAPKAIPLNTVTVSVGMESVRVEDAFAIDGTTVLVNDEYCRKARLVIRLGIHVPFARGGETCHAVFTEILDCLTFLSDLEIAQSGCGSIQADRDTDALVLTAHITVAADFCPAQGQSPSFGSFMDKELLCGSHIRNDDLHVTAEDKTLWNAPFAMGTYFGDAAATRTIAVGFTPRAVAVFAMEQPFAAVDFAAGKSKTLAGFAADGVRTQGLECTAAGFRLMQSATHETATSLPRLNEAGTAYFYFALR